MSLFGAFKSVQRGTITVSATVTADAAGITSVDTSKSTLTYLGWSSASAVLDRINTRIALAGATTVTANKATAADAVTVSFELVERY